MSATILMLIIFESNTAELHSIYAKIESFLMVQVFILIIDLLFFLYKEARKERRSFDSNETFMDRVRNSSCGDIFTNVVSGLLYTFQIAWILYGNKLYF